MTLTDSDIPKARSQLNNIPVYKTAELPASVEANINPLLLGSNENRLGASPNAVAAIKDYLMSNNLALYPSSARSHLIQKLAQFHKVPNDYLLIGNGSLDVTQIVIRTFSDRDDEVIVSEFVYAQIPILCQAEGLKVIKVSATNYGHDLNLMVSHITAKTKMIIVVNPNNPTGTWLEEASLKKFLSHVPKKILVVIDEAYFEYLQSITPIDTVKMLAEFPNLILIRTFSKVYGLAGLRVGYAIGSASLITAMSKVQPPFSVNTLALIAALAALDDIQHVNKTINSVNHERQLLKNHLEQLNISYINSAGNFIMINTGKLTEGLYTYLKQNNIYVRPLDNYSLSSFLRVTIGKNKDMLALIHHLKYYLMIAK